MNFKIIIRRSFCLFSLLFLIFCLFSCRNNQSENIRTIRINPKAVNDEISLKIKSIVLLETTDTSLVGHINTVKYYKNKYYIFDQNISKTLFVYDSNGKFINKTRLGKGPGEVIEPWSFCINESDNTILLWDQMQFNLNVYDLNLSFIRSIYCPRIAIRSLSPLNNNSFLILSQFYPIDKGKKIENILYDYFVYENNFKTLSQKIHITDIRTSNVTMDNPICNINNGCCFIAPMDNNIYKLTTNYETKPVYRFDLGRFQVTDEDLDKGTQYYRSEMKKGNRICSLCNLFMNSNYVTISYSFKNRTEFCIFNKTTHTIINSVDPTLEKQLPRCEIKGLLEDNTFIGIANAMDYNRFMEHKTEDANLKFAPVDDFSNQVIILFSVD